MSEQDIFRFKSFTPASDMVAHILGWDYAIIAGIIWRYSQMEDGHCWASQKMIAKRARMSRDTVNKKIKILIEHGFIEDLTPGLQGETHRYVLTDLAFDDYRLYNQD